MKTKISDEALGKFESVTTIIVNLGTIVSWIFSLIAFLLLAIQPKPISFAGYFELGKPFLLVFLISILFGYIQVLRNHWYTLRKKRRNIDSSFGAFLYSSIVKFKRPFILVGFVILLIVLFQVEPAGFIVIWTFVFLVGGSIVWYLVDNRPIVLKRVIWHLDDEFYMRWHKRIKNQLHEDGYVNTNDFSQLGAEIEQINWAIELYFNRYEFEQKLVLEKIAQVESFAGKDLLELRFENLPSKIRSNAILD